MFYMGADVMFYDKLVKAGNSTLDRQVLGKYIHAIAVAGYHFLQAFYLTGNDFAAVAYALLICHVLTIYPQGVYVKY